MADLTVMEGAKIDLSAGVSPIFKRSSGHIVNSTSFKDDPAEDIDVVDAEWVRSRFMVAGRDLSDIDRTNRFFTTAHWKFTDTTLGGHIAINPRPQYTRYADIRHGGRRAVNEVTVQKDGGSNNQTNFGMGRYYSEAIDDNATTIFMEFGIPKFNSLITFFTRAVDGIDSYIAKHGRMPSQFLYEGAKWAGGTLTFVLFPLSTTLVWLAKRGVEAVQMGDNQFNFYYFQPAMHMYWSSVNAICTILCTELGIITPVLSGGSTTQAQKMGTAMRFDQADFEEMRKVFPDVFKNGNYVDVFTVATRSQARANRMLLDEYEQYGNDQSSATDFVGYAKKFHNEKEYMSPGKTVMDAVNYYSSFDGFLGRIIGGKKGGELYTKDLPITDNPAVQQVAATNPGGAAGEGAAAGASVDKSAAGGTSDANVGQFVNRNSDGSYDIALNESEKEYSTNFFKVVDATVRDGGMFVSFNVDYQGAVSESFSNSTGEIQTKDMIKSVAKGVQDMRFNFAGGSISETVDEVVGMAKSVVAGFLEGVTLGFSNVLATIFGGGYIDIPKKWEDSSMSLPSITYKTRLVSPYGNPLAQLQNIYIPLSCLLAGTLPMSVGKMSYTSPFLCRLFNKGVQKIDLGMITSLSIERGTSNLGFSKNKKALAIDVSWTVTDFSTMVTAPVSRTTFEKAFRVALEEEKPIHKYLSVVASRDFLTNRYAMPKIRLALARKIGELQSVTSQSYWGLKVGEKLNGPLGIFASEAQQSQMQSNFLF